ncbi:hypothetical protein NQ318_008653 [Aromia moschata]|uniref:Uncharacterized protein n=1 Tax=Aromia moschata TaxID=1265417 RepID=A0AAV8XTI7_9CUCU|nr:hypothetical protein NQ318_008653 [Aromia moschata]
MNYDEDTPVNIFTEYNVNNRDTLAIQEYRVGIFSGQIFFGTGDSTYSLERRKSFYSNGKPNRRNEHYWATENPYYVNPIQNQRHYGINVWCGIIGRYLIGPHFYDHILDTNKETSKTIRTCLLSVFASGTTRAEGARTELRTPRSQLTGVASCVCGGDCATQESADRASPNLAARSGRGLNNDSGINYHSQKKRDLQLSDS